MNMRVRSHCQAAMGVALGSLCTPLALADGRVVGDTVLYELTRTNEIHTELPSQSSAMQAQVHAMQNRTNGKKTTTQFTLKTDQIDADGNAHFGATYTQSFEGVSGAAAGAFATPQALQGTLTSDGQVIAAFDESSLKTKPPYSASDLQNLHGLQIQRLFADFNTMVIGISKHPNLKAGDSWRLIAPNSVGVTRSYDFSVTEAPMVSMTEEFEDGNSTTKIVATGRYDSARRLLVSFHEENTFSSTRPGVMSSSGVISTDIKLR
jgi:hypothetical protein